MLMWVKCAFDTNYKELLIAKYDQNIMGMFETDFVKNGFHFFYYY